MDDLLTVSGKKSKKTAKQWIQSYDGQKAITSIVFLLIPVALLILFTFVPAANMVVYSFQKRSQLGTDIEWVGLDNYKTIFSDSSYLMTFKNSIYYLIGSFIQQALALLVASVLCTRLRCKNFFKGVLFFPYLMNGVAVSLIFLNFFKNGDGVVSPQGTLNSILSVFGVEPYTWLGAETANFCLVFVSLWRYIGFDILMYIGAIQSINTDVYEAAELDGANSWQRFRYIVFPSIKSIIALQCILAVNGAISVFETPYIITGGKNGTTTFVIKTIETAFTYDKIGLASAMAMVLLSITIVVTIIQKTVFKEET